MAAFLLYIIKLSISLTLFYAGYRILLSNETFFHFNRKVLLTGMLCCLALPLIQIRTATPGILQQPMIQLEKIMMDEELSPTFSANILPSSHETAASSNPSDKTMPSVSLIHLLVIIFATGSFVNFCLLIRSHVSLALLIRKGRKIKRGRITIVLYDRPVTPFNYGRYIILSEDDYRDNQDSILTHELAHCRLQHSFDIAIVEIITLFQWFNPVIWALKKDIRKIHEFQADAEVLNSGIDVTKYQLLLMNKAVNAKSYIFANSLNNSKLKNRIIMMSKKKSNSWARMKLLLLLPLAALSVYAFVRPEVTRQLEQIIRSEEQATSSSNQKFSPEFFEAELNKYISELGGSANLTVAEKFKFLYDKTNTVTLSINSKDDFLFGRITISGERYYMRGENLAFELLSDSLKNALITEYPNNKPVLITMVYDRGSSSRVVNDIFQLVGKVFTENEALLRQKKQPVLLIVDDPKTDRAQNAAVIPNENLSIYILVKDNTGKELQSFKITNLVEPGSSKNLDYHFFSELEGWLKTQKKEDLQFLTAYIRASPDTKMGIIADFKYLFRDLVRYVSYDL